ncbi:unnamed protein product [Vitrella brassicaformis CCMP3155]|uniref:Uncharacterized protein n=1 Tax=Vitrella brassicaformis (strain CCMP3155) TaxID=1169540 RepID=A0A0G4H870_VITBC|nr:unnamed protein product [Vitrella brassicaformis CCMP3155]|eukprot:CEM39940.1 unnamed protein product [Vitrella brassicaformis CCMP3155]
MWRLYVFGLSISSLHVICVAADARRSPRDVESGLLSRKVPEPPGDDGGGQDKDEAHGKTGNGRSGQYDRHRAAEEPFATEQLPLFFCPFFPYITAQGLPFRSDNVTNTIEAGTNQFIAVDLVFARNAGFNQIMVAANSREGLADIIIEIDEEPFDRTNVAQDDSDSTTEAVIVVPTDKGRYLDIFIEPKGDMPSNTVTNVSDSND